MRDWACLTLYLVYDQLKQGRLKLEDELPVTEKAWRMQGSKMFVQIGGTVKVEDLIRGVVVQSGNDAAIVLAESIGGTEEGFAEKMNAKAKELGLTHSFFKNCTGWPDPEQHMEAPVGAPRCDRERVCPGWLGAYAAPRLVYSSTTHCCARS